MNHLPPQVSVRHTSFGYDYKWTITWTLADGAKKVEGAHGYRRYLRDEMKETTQSSSLMKDSRPEKASMSIMICRSEIEQVGYLNNFRINLLRVFDNELQERQ